MKTLQQVIEYEAATSIAITIVAKLGGRNFTKSVGATRLEAMDHGVLICIPSNLAANSINRVKIKLNEDSTYDVRFIFSNNATYTRRDVAIVQGVPAELLRATFTENTGLACDINEVTPY